MIAWFRVQFGINSTSEWLLMKFCYFPSVACFLFLVGTLLKASLVPRLISSEKEAGNEAS